MMVTIGNDARDFEFYHLHHHLQRPLCRSGRRCSSRLPPDEHTRVEVASSLQSGRLPRRHRRSPKIYASYKSPVDSPPCEGEVYPSISFRCLNDIVRLRSKRWRCRQRSVEVVIPLVFSGQRDWCRGCIAVVTFFCSPYLRSPTHLRRDPQTQMWRSLRNEKRWLSASHNRTAYIQSSTIHSQTPT